MIVIACCILRIPRLLLPSYSCATRITGDAVDGRQEAAAADHNGSSSFFPTTSPSDQSVARHTLPPVSLKPVITVTGSPLLTLPFNLCFLVR